MSIEELVQEHRHVAKVARRRGEDALRLWYADLAVEVNGDMVSYFCPQCGLSQARTTYEFVYSEANEHLICNTCRGDVEERAGALD